MILKHIITLTVLRDTEVEQPSTHAMRDTDPITGYGLLDIAHNIEDGPWLGQMAVVSTEVVAPEQVADECKALGNDGSFFDIGI